MSEINNKILKAREDPLSGNLTAEFVDAPMLGLDLIYSDSTGVNVMTKATLDTLFDETKYSHLIFEVTDTEFYGIEPEVSDIQQYGYSMVPLPLVVPENDGGISRWYGLSMNAPVIRDGKIIATRYSMFLEYANRRLTYDSFEPMELAFRFAIYDAPSEGWVNIVSDHLNITKIYGIPKRTTT